MHLKLVDLLCENYNTINAYIKFLFYYYDWCKFIKGRGQSHILGTTKCPNKKDGRSSSHGKQFYSKNLVFNGCACICFIRYLLPKSKASRTMVIFFILEYHPLVVLCKRLTKVHLINSFIRSWNIGVSSWHIYITVHSTSWCSHNNCLYFGYIPV